jgi:hypothetical protein
LTMLWWLHYALATSLWPLLASCLFLLVSVGNRMSGCGVHSTSNHMLAALSLRLETISLFAFFFIPQADMAML